MLICATLIGALLVTGCQGTSKQTGDSQPEGSKGRTQRPALIVPKEFTDEQAKLDFAVNAVNDKYYQEARPLLEEILQSKPEPVVYKKLGTVLYNTGDGPGAIAAWSTAAELDPAQTSEMENNIGNVQRDAQKYQEAEASYRRAIAKDPTRWQSAINLATMLRVTGRLQDGITVLQAALAANPDAGHIAELLETLRSESQAPGE